MYVKKLLQNFENFPSLSSNKEEMATNKGARAASKTVESDVEVVAMKRAPKLLDKVSKTLCNFFDTIFRKR